MNSKRLSWSLTLTILFSILNFVSYTNSSNPPTALTNAPGESNCRGCHSGSALVTSGNSWNSITLTANAQSTLEYFPDSNFHLVLTANISGITKYGFEVTALDSAKNKAIGLFTITNSTATAKGSSVVAGSSRDYIYQKSGGTAAQNGNTITWSFDWKAPSTLAGPIKFYAVVNATNNNGNDNGDVVYAKVFTMRPSALLPKIKVTANAASLCQGDTLFCQTTATNVKSYAWKVYNGTTLVSNDTGASPYFVMNSSGTFKVKVTGLNDKGSVSDSLSIKVITKPLVSIVAKGPIKFCSSDSVMLFATATAGSSLQWNNGDTVAGIYVRASGNYQCTANLSGCRTPSNTIQVEVAPRLPRPVISCGNASLNSITWNWQSSVGAQNYEVSEDQGASWIQPSSGSAGLSHQRSGLMANKSYTLWVRAKDSLPCGASDMDSMTCITANCSPIVYSVQFDSIRCVQQYDTIRFHISSTTKFAIKYNNVYSSDSVYIVQAFNDSIYNFEIVDSNQLACIPAKVNVMVKIASIHVSLTRVDSGACLGIPQTFIATKGFVRYIFKDIYNKVLQDGSNNTYSTADTTELKGIKVNAFNAWGCGDLVAVGPSLIYPIPKPVFSYTTNSGSYMVSFNTGSSPKVKSEWFFGDGQNDTSGNKAPSHNYASAGKYKVTLRETKNGCSGDTTMEIDLVALGLPWFGQENNFSVFPNPFDELLSVTTNGDYLAITGASLYNIQGQEKIFISENQLNKNNQLFFATGDLPAGVYILKIITIKGQQLFYRVVKR